MSSSIEFVNFSGNLLSLDGLDNISIPSEGVLRIENCSLLTNVDSLQNLAPQIEGGVTIESHRWSYLTTLLGINSAAAAAVLLLVLSIGVDADDFAVDEVVGSFKIGYMESYSIDRSFA